MVPPHASRLLAPLPPILPPSVQRGRGEKECLLFNGVGLKVTSILPLALQQQELCRASPESRPAWKRRPWLDGHPPAAPLCRGGRRVASGTKLLCLLQTPLGAAFNNDLRADPAMEVPGLCGCRRSEGERARQHEALTLGKSLIDNLHSHRRHRKKKQIHPEQAGGRK